jgi:hypothetical protein
MDKAQAAKNLLIDDFFMGEIQALKDGCLQTFQNSRPDDYEEREAAYRRLNAINEIVAHFESIAAEKAIEQKRRRFF